MIYLTSSGKYRYPVIFLSLLSVLLLSCQTNPTTATHVYPKKGMLLSELINAYGEPDEVTQEYGMEMNRNMWNLSDARLVSPSNRSSGHNTTISGGQVVTTTSATALPEIKQIYCTLVVFTGPDSKVQDLEMHGNGCRQILLNEL